MSVITKEYVVTAPDYTHHYEIEYRKHERKQHYEIWVLYHPEDPWGKDDHTHHLCKSGQVCVREGREPRDFEFAEAIAHYWMERFSRYVATGTFEDHGAAVHTPDQS